MLNNGAGLFTVIRWYLLPHRIQPIASKAFCIKSNNSEAILVSKEYKFPFELWDPFIDWKPDDTSGEYVIIYPNGTKIWHKDGEWHRENGPAIGHTNGHKEYWYKGRRYFDPQTDEEWFELIKLKFLW